MKKEKSQINSRNTNEVSFDGLATAEVTLNQVIH